MTFTASDLIPVKSPLALTGVFLEILRARFSADYELPWVYYPLDEGRAQSTIHIEAGGNALTEDFSRRPAIFVTRNPISFAQIAIGDREGFVQRKGSETFYCIAQTGFTFAVEAEEPGEAEQIADIVLCTLMMGSDQIERTFSFNKLGPFAISQVAHIRQDVEITQIQIQMGLSYDVKWSTSPVAPILKEIVVKLRASPYNDSNDYFTTIYQNSLAFNPKSPTSGGE